jgi:hypothetical protein
MPGVNWICNMIVSDLAGVFEVLLRQDAAMRNFRNIQQKCTALARSGQVIGDDARGKGDL